MANHTYTIKSAEQKLVNSTAITDKADSKVCFQMGMVYLLGIKTPIDLKKAADYFKSQSLAQDTDAKRLLGFIAEMQGNYSQAFEYYASVTPDKKKTQIEYLSSVKAERINLVKFLGNLKLPDILNNNITAALNDYLKEDSDSIEASVKMSMICKDERSYLDVAQKLYNKGEKLTAMGWLLENNISANTSFFSKLEKDITEFSKSLVDIKSLESIELQGSNLLTNGQFSQTVENVRMSLVENAFDQEASKCYIAWEKSVQKIVNAIIRKLDIDEELKRENEKRKREEELRKLEEEELLAKKKIKIKIIYLVIFVLFLLVGDHTIDYLICVIVICLLLFSISWYRRIYKPSKAINEE